MLNEGEPAIEMVAAGLEKQAKCEGKPELYSDYVTAPKAEVAAAMCSGCPLIEQCRRLARDVKPTWGVWAGEVYLAQGVSKKSLKIA